MPRFLSPIYVKQEIVTGNETISGNETILGVTSGRTSYWTTVNSELSVSSNLGWFNNLSSINLSTNKIDSYSISANDVKSISAIGEIALYQTVTGVTIKADKFYGDGSGITGILASGGYSTDIYKLPLTGGVMTGPISFGESYGPRLDQGKYDTNRGGLSGISLVCSLDYDFNWQAGWLTVLQQDRLTPMPLYIDSGAGTSIKLLSGGYIGSGGTGIELSHNGITFSDNTTQTTAFTGIPTDPIFNSISAVSLSGTFYGDGSRLTGINNGSTIDSTKLPLTGGTINGDLTVTGTFSTQNTEKWNNTYNNVSTNSAKWDSVYSNVNTNSASWTTTVNLSTNVLELQNLTAGFTSTSNTVNTNSAKWENTYSTVNTYSANWTSTINLSTNVLALQNLTAGFTNTSNTVNTNSAKWESVYSNVNSNSATYVILTGTQTLTNKTVIDWMTLVRGYNTIPVLLATIPSGEVYSYVYTSSPSNITYYRFISTDGSTDIFYTYFSGTTLSGVVASKSITL